MKYLKSYNESVEPTDIVEFLKDLQDICLELTDEGFHFITEPEEMFSDRYINFVENHKTTSKSMFDGLLNRWWMDIRHKDLFSFSQVSDALMRIEDFTKQFNFVLDMRIHTNHNRFTYQSCHQLDTKTFPVGGRPTMDEKNILNIQMFFNHINN